MLSAQKIEDHSRLRYFGYLYLFYPTNTFQPSLLPRRAADTVKQEIRNDGKSLTGTRGILFRQSWTAPPVFDRVALDVRDSGWPFYMCHFYVTIFKYRTGGLTLSAVVCPLPCCSCASSHNVWLEHAVQPNVRICFFVFLPQTKRSNQYRKTHVPLPGGGQHSA